MRTFILLMLLTTYLAAEEAAPAITAVEQAKILAEIKAKRQATALSTPEKSADMAKYTSAKEDEAARSRTAKLARDAEDYNKKAIGEGRDAIASCKQFQERLKTEGSWADDREIYTKVVSLKKTAGSNAQVLDHIAKAKGFLVKRDEARAKAGLPKAQEDDFVNWLMVLPR